MANIKNLENELWEAADNLRANSKLTSQQYCMPVLGLIFLRYAWGRYNRVDVQIKQERAQQQGRQIPIEQEDYTSRGAMFLPLECRYDTLLNLPDEANVSKKINEAMSKLEEQNPQLTGVLPKTYGDLGNDLLREVMRIFNNPELDAEGDDIIGRIYEYFLGKFAPAVASDDGVFFTPKSLVRMIMNVLEPKRGVVFDPACGSGGMFVSASDYVREQGGNPNESLMYYGQEKVDYNAKLCLMNMAVHGMNGSIKSGDEANSFYHDAHSLNGKCDYVAANPPFNVDKVKAEEAQVADRLPLGIPSINKNKEFSKGNYLWINYFYSYLSTTGRAGFVMASSASDSQQDRNLRQALVKTGHVDALIYVGNNFFYTKSLPCTLWFFDKGKPKQYQNRVLFINAQDYHTVLDATHNEWSPWQLKNLAAIVWLYRGEVEKYEALVAEYVTAIQGLASSFDSNDDIALTGVSGIDDFETARDYLQQAYDDHKEQSKNLIAAASRREKKQLVARLAEQDQSFEEALTLLGEAIWLAERFGSGEYENIAGFCNVATIKEIEDKAWSLTPGAYVGVPPVEDEGVDFTERMTEIHEELLKLQDESNELMQKISDNFARLGGSGD